MTINNNSSRIQKKGEINHNCNRKKKNLEFSWLNLESGTFPFYSYTWHLKKIQFDGCDIWCWYVVIIIIDIQIARIIILLKHQFEWTTQSFKWNLTLIFGQEKILFLCNQKKKLRIQNWIILISGWIQKKGKSFTIFLDYRNFCYIYICNHTFSMNQNRTKLWNKKKKHDDEVTTWTGCFCCF